MPSCDQTLLRVGGNPYMRCVRSIAGSRPPIDGTGATQAHWRKSATPGRTSGVADFPLAALKKNPAKGEAGPRWPRYAEDGKRAAEACLGRAKRPAGSGFFWARARPVPLE